jgi:hypothetical protein
MAEALGSLAGLLLALIVTLCVAGFPVVILAHWGLRVRRAWRREQQERRPRQPYDDAYERALWDRAAANGYADGTRRAIEGL